MLHMACVRTATAPVSEQSSRVVAVIAAVIPFFLAFLSKCLVAHISETSWNQLTATGTAGGIVYGNFVENVHWQSSAQKANTVLG